MTNDISLSLEPRITGRFVFTGKQVAQLDLPGGFQLAVYPPRGPYLFWVEQYDGQIDMSLVSWLKEVPRMTDVAWPESPDHGFELAEVVKQTVTGHGYAETEEGARLLAEIAVWEEQGGSR